MRVRASLASAAILAGTVDRVGIRRPGGQVQVLMEVPVDALATETEPK